MEKENQNKSKVIIIILLVFILVGISITAYFMISDKTLKDIKNISKSEDEYTISLDEFITNLKNEDKGKNYLKIQVALMYKDKKHTELMESNLNKIRDIVLNDLREKTSEQILEVKNTPKLKEDLLKKLNDSLGEEVIQDIYFTNLIVQ